MIEKLKDAEKISPNKVFVDINKLINKINEIIDDRNHLKKLAKDVFEDAIYTGSKDKQIAVKKLVEYLKED